MKLAKEILRLKIPLFLLIMGAVTMAILTAALLRGTAFGGISPTHKAVPFLSILSEEADRIWPEADKCIFAGQIQAESAWREVAERVEPNGRTSYSLMQVLDVTFKDRRDV